MSLILALAPLAHLVGDYVLQSHAMAIRKTSSWTWAGIHAAFYSIPFAVLLFLLAPDRALVALLVIGGTHAVIDRLALGARWARWYGNGHPGLWWREADGDFPAPPPFLGVWLTIIVDNTMHLCINAAALAWAVS